jgi:DNA repair exonuclease SbcCD nuclease subunit
MKILTLSDLEWNIESKEISDIDIGEFPIRKDFSSVENRAYFRSMKFRSYWRYRSIIEETKPDIVLLAGDITGDGSCGHGFHKALFLLFRYLEYNKITTFFISGNHDEPKYFKYILERTRGLKYVKYIARKVVEYGGIKILGLDYLDTYNKTNLKGFISKNFSLDIVLSHCHLHRRTSLFDFDTKYVITGHWDQNIGQVENTVFISLVNDTPEDVNYLTIEFNKNQELVSYYNFNSIINNIKTHNAIKKGKSLDYKPNSSELTSTKFCDAVNLLRKAKRIGADKLSEIERGKLEWIINPDFSRIFVTDYLGVKFLDMSDGYGLKLKKT